MSASAWTTVLFLLACSKVASSSASSSQQYGHCFGTLPRNQTGPPRGEPAERLQLKADAFVRVKDGQEVLIKGISWMGNTSALALDGLWSSDNNSNNTLMELATLAYQLRRLGFNGIRLPFVFSGLGAPPGGAPAAATAAGPAPTARLERLLWTVQWFVANGFYVILDCHVNATPAAAPPGPRAGLVGNWRWLWAAVTCLPGFRDNMQGRVFLDLLKQPNLLSLRWEPQTPDKGEHMPGLGELYLQAMDALEQLVPGGALYFVEGGGQQAAHDGLHWGNGFVTDAGLIARHGLSDPNPFFRALLQRSYRDRVVLTPNIRHSRPFDPSPPAAAGAAAAASSSHLASTPGPAPADGPTQPTALKVLDATFGYLTKHGYCLSSDNCQRFPVALAEVADRPSAWGAASPEDVQDFAAWLSEAGVASEDNGTAAVGSWFRYSFASDTAAFENSTQGNSSRRGA